MKKIYYIMLAILAMSFTFVACSDEAPFSTATADDEPRILYPIFANSENGKPPVIATLSRDANLNMTLTVTPADYTTVVWLIDGYEIQDGKTLEINLKAGTYAFKVTVSSKAGKSTYREGIVQINPLPDDPWATEIGVERIIVPGTKARFYGNNLDKVKSIIVDGKTITDVVYSEEGDYIEYAVPADLEESEHRVIFVDANGNEYGAGKVKVSQSALVTGGADRTNANKEWVITGVNLDKIASLTFAGQTITEFAQQTATKIVIVCPELEDGEYSLTSKTKDGKDVQFYNAGVITAKQTVIVSSETVLWQGHHYVSWDMPDDSPNKKFDLIGKDVFASIKPGATLSIYYSVASEATYHQLRTTSGWWNDLPGTAVIEFSEGGVKEVQLTQEVLDKIQAEDGFLIIGHGYYVDKVAVL